MNYHNIFEKFSLIFQRFILIIALCLLTLITLEFSGRILLKLLGENTETHTRPFQPYFTSGDFYGNVDNQTLLESREGPESSGYKKHYGLYFNQPQKREWNAHWRADFLFDHMLSRYSAKDIDNIIKSEPNSIKIFVVGGSAAQGSSASSKDVVWHSQLEKLLRKTFKRHDIYVFNAAMGAFISTQERIAFDLAVASRKSDLIIVLDGFNDINIPFEMAVAPGDPMQVGRRYTQIYDNSLWRFLAEHSQIIKFVQKRMVNNYLAQYKKEVSESKDLSLVNGITQTYTENVKYLINRGKQMNTPVIFFLQPWKSLSKYKINNSDQDITWVELSCYQNIKQQLKTNEAQGNFFDLTNIFSTDKKISFYTDAVHLDDNGQKVFAENIGKILIPKVKQILAKRSSDK